MKKICVIGSLNVDLTATVPRFHEPGETIFGSDFKTYTGGKGGNQAVAAAKLGADVTMVGCLGDDANAGIYRELMKDLGIRDCVETAPGLSSGVALIEVDSKGENRILVISGANMAVTKEMIDASWEHIAECDIFLLQLEIPMETNSYVVDKLHAAGKTIILDPAPAAPLPENILTKVDFIIPNETELALLSGHKTDTEEEIVEGAKVLLDRGCRNVIVKMGGRGSMLVNSEGIVRKPGFKVNAVDTTAAGDSFNAGFGVALAMGRTVPDAITFANAVGALSTTAVGAQGAMPSMAQVEEMIR